VPSRSSAEASARSRDSNSNEKDGDSFARGTAIAGLVIAVVSLVVGIGGYLLNKDQIEEERRTVFRAYGYVNAHEETTHGYGARVILVNESLRPVVVERAFLQIEGHPEAAIYYYLSDARVLAQYRLDPGAVEREKELLPLVVDARSVRTVGLLLNLAVLNKKKGNEDKPAVVAAKREFCRIASIDSEKGLSIRLRVTPGESEELELEGEEFELDIAGFKDSRPPWVASVLGPRGDPQAIRLSRRFAEPIAGRLVTMTVWESEESGNRHETTRPLVGPAAATFPLPELSRGRHPVTFSEDGRVVLAAQLEVPTPRHLAGSFDLAREIEPAGPCTLFEEQKKLAGD
jgi:hypothetical protein